MTPRIGKLVVSILAALVGVGLVVAAAFVEAKSDGFVLLNLGLLCLWLGVLGCGRGG